MIFPMENLLRIYLKTRIAYLEDEYQASNCKVLYEKEITLSDGTKAYEFEINGTIRPSVIYLLCERL